MREVLQDPHYQQKGGSLPDKKNTEIQNLLNAKITSMDVRATAKTKVYKEQTKLDARDLIAASHNGVIQDSDKVTELVKTLGIMGENKLMLQVMRSQKIAPAIKGLQMLPDKDHQAFIGEVIPRLATGNEAEALKTFFNKKSNQISRRIQDDARGLYEELNVSKPLVAGTKGFFKNTIELRNQASRTYGVKAKALTKKIANNYAKQFQFATIGAKKELIAMVASEVPNKSDRDAIFTQIDQQKNGNLNVYADLMDRGEELVVDAIEEGRQLRNDKTLNLVPKDIKPAINVELANVFVSNTERRSYLEAVMDYYAKLNDVDGIFNEENYNSERMKIAIKAVVGNIVEYQGKNFLLPNNEMEAGDFEDWIYNLDPAYITELGGIENLTPEKLLEMIKDEEIIISPSLVRGEYLLMDLEGNYLSTKNTDGGKSSRFTLIYDKTKSKDTSGWWPF